MFCWYSLCSISLPDGNVTLKYFAISVCNPEAIGSYLGLEIALLTENFRLSPYDL
jgi:hypothetical protein